MHFLQAVVDKESNWFNPFLEGMLMVIVVYGIGILIFYLVIRAAIRSGTSHLRRQSTIANELHAEDLRMRGVPDQRIDEILRSK